MIETVFGIALSIFLVAWAIHLVVCAWTMFSEHACSLDTMKDLLHAYDFKLNNAIEQYIKKYEKERINEKETVAESVDTNAIYIKSPPPTQEYEPVCPRGYNDCIWDPARIQCKNPEWYKRLYGDMTPEEAVNAPTGCKDKVKEDPDEKYYCYDDEEK